MSNFLLKFVKLLTQIASSQVMTVYEIVQLYLQNLCSRGLLS